MKKAYLYSTQTLMITNAMYNTLNDMGIAPIKCQNKASDEKVKDLHYAINDLIYKYRFCLISGPMAKYLTSKLSEYRKDLRELYANEKGQIREKVAELGKRVSEYINTLNTYNPGESETDNARVLKKRVAEYVKVKDTMDFNSTLQFAKDNWILNRKYHAEIPSFVKMQKELVQNLNNYVVKLSFS